MPTIRVVMEEETYRLITDGEERFAVIEVRAGHVYSLDPRHTLEARDSADGMGKVVGPRGWRSHADAQRIFDHMVRGERHLAECLW